MRIEDICGVKIWQPIQLDGADNISLRHVTFSDIA